MKPVAVSSIPPLKSSTGQWMRTSEEKANLLAETFDSKSHLAAAVVNQFTPPAVDTFQLPSVNVRIAEADVEEILTNLQPDSGTGPDKIAARYLKHCRFVLKPMLSCLFTLFAGRVLANFVAKSLGACNTQTQITCK